MKKGASYCTSSHASDYCTSTFGKKKVLHFEFEFWLFRCPSNPSDRFSLLRVLAKALIFFPLWLLLSNLNILIRMAGFLAPPPLAAQLDWPPKSKSVLRELPVIMKGYERRWSWQISLDAESRLTVFTLWSLLFIKRWTEFWVCLLIYSYVNSLIWIKNSLMSYKNLLTTLLLMFYILNGVLFNPPLIQE